MAAIEVVIGTIGRAHGLRGEVSVEPHTDEPERRFVAGAVVGREEDRRPLTIRSVRWQSGRLIVAFDEVTDRTAAEGLRGTVLVVDVAADERPSSADEFYDRQLLGLTVLDAGKVARGIVRSVLHPGAQDLLVVATDAGERLVPFVAALVPVVDLDAGTLTLADVPGLLSDVEEDDG